MPSLLSLARTLRRAAVVIATAGCAWPALLAAAPADDTDLDGQKSMPRVALAKLIDRIPDLLDLGLPGFAPLGAVRIYSHPRFGDLLHESYFRLPVGARVKVRENVELNGELGSYFTHGLRDPVGYGFYEARLGIKYEQVVSPDSGRSYGVDFVTPLSRPPHGITDGLRHTVPYVTFTHTVVPRWGLVGFATLGADFIAGTALPVDYRTNQLRADSLVLTAGVAREWHDLQFILKAFDGNTALLSSREQNVFGLRPSIGIPVLRRHDGTPRAVAIFEGRTVWGPDGFETGISTTVRVDFRYRARRH